MNKISRRAAINQAKNQIAAAIEEYLPGAGIYPERCIDDPRVLKIPVLIHYEQSRAFGIETIELEIYIKEVQA